MINAMALPLAHPARSTSSCTIGLRSLVHSSTPLSDVCVRGAGVDVELDDVRVRVVIEFFVVAKVVAVSIA
jgi:hypothetical protein